MVSLNKPNRPQRSKFSPLEKAFAQALCCVYYRAPQDQRDEAVNRLIEELKAEKAPKSHPDLTKNRWE